MDLLYNCIGRWWEQKDAEKCQQKCQRIDLGLQTGFSIPTYRWKCLYEEDSFSFAVTPTVATQGARLCSSHVLYIPGHVYSAIIAYRGLKDQRELSVAVETRKVSSWEEELGFKQMWHRRY